LREQGRRRVFEGAWNGGRRVFEVTREEEEGYLRERGTRRVF
jgi:hypothetical protein